MPDVDLHVVADNARERRIKSECDKISKDFDKFVGGLPKKGDKWHV